MEIIPLVKHSNKRIRDGKCHFAGCKNDLLHFFAHDKCNLCPTHKNLVEQKRGEVRFTFNRMSSELTDYFAHFVPRDKKLLYKYDGIYFSACCENEFMYHWFLYTKWFDIESCVQINGTYDLPQCIIFDLIFTAVQHDVIKNIKNKCLQRVDVLPEDAKIFSPI